MTRSYRTKSSGQTDLETPRLYGKHNSSLNKPKKNGGGRGNWGREGDEIIDHTVNMTKPRRKSNCSAHTSGRANFKSKFEHVEPEPVFIDAIHGARPSDYLEAEAESETPASATSTAPSEADSTSKSP